jgi:hypothetical protein
VWKKVAESKDLIIFENSLKNHKLKIEARKKHTGWEVFQTKIKGENSSLLSEFSLDNKDQVKDLIEKLKKKVIPPSKARDNKSINLYMKRAYKEDYVEKWLFFIGESKSNNVVIVKYGPTIYVELILDEKFTSFERVIISQIEDRLGLKDEGQVINYNLYYFRKHSSISKESEPEYNVDFMDMEFGFNDEDINSA